MQHLASHKPGPTMNAWGLPGAMARFTLSGADPDAKIVQRYLNNGEEVNMSRYSSARAVNEATAPSACSAHVILRDGQPVAHPNSNPAQGNVKHAHDERSQKMNP